MDKRGKDNCENMNSNTAVQTYSDANSVLPANSK